MGEWKPARLRDVGVKLIDCVHKTPEAQLEGYPYVGIPQMQNGRIDFSTARRISTEDYSEWTKKAKPQRHDVILSRRTNPGVTAVDDTGTAFALGQNLVILRADGTQIYPPFLKWMTQSPYWWGQIAKFNNVGAVFDSLKCVDVPNFELPVPPLTEQCAIASALGALDDKIELNRRMNGTLEAMARAIFKDWFVDFGPTRAKMAMRGEDPQRENVVRAPYLAPDIWSLFPDRLDDEGKPEGWTTGKLGDIAQQTGVSVSPEQLDPATPYIGLEHMPRRSIALAEWNGAGKVTSGKTAFRKGDFLFGKLRPYFHKVGIAPIDGICSTDIVVLNARERFAGAFVLACISRDEFVAFTDRTSDGTKMPRTNWGRMARYELCLPNKSGFEAFEVIARPMLDRIIGNIHEARTLAATRDLLLPKLMSGEIRVKDAETLVGEVA